MKKSKKAEKKSKPQKKETVPGARFEGTKKLLAQCGVKTKAVTSKLVCNILDCKKKLAINGKLDGKPISRHRWCPEHKTFTNRVRNMAHSLMKHGYSPKKLSEKRFDVRGGKLTLWARLHGVDEEKAIARYKTGRKGSAWFGLTGKRVKAKKKAVRRVEKKLVSAAKKVVRAVAKPAPKKVPAPNLKKLLNGKGADVQAAVAAHAAKKKAEAKP